MSRRKYVIPNMQVVNPLIKKVFRSYTVFAEKMGRGDYPTWVSNWNRKDKDGNWNPKNLPSPEEAAQMCVLLQTTPEEILVKPEDIALVNSLLEQEKGIKKQPAANSDEPDKKALLDIVKSSDDEAFLLSVLQEVSKKLQEKHHGD